MKLTLHFTPRALAKLKDMLEDLERRHRGRFVIEPVWLRPEYQRYSHWGFGFHEWDKCQGLPAESYANIDGVPFVYSGMPHLLDDLAQRNIDWAQDRFVFSKPLKKN